MKHNCHTKSSGTLQNRAVFRGGSFCFPPSVEPETITTGIKGKGMKTQTWHTGNYRAKLANAFVRTARSSLAVSEKIILAGGLRYFSRKPCLTEGICRRALVVHGLPKPEYSQLKKIKRHEPSICNKHTASSREDAHAGNEKKKTDGTRTCRQVPATGDDRAGTHLHPVEPDSGNQPPSRQEQAAGQTVQ